MDESASAGMLLPRELLELQLGDVDLLKAMYPSDGSVLMSETCNAAIEELREWLAGDLNAEDLPSIPSTIDMVLLVDADGQEPSQDGMTRDLQLSISVPLRYGSQGEEAPSANEPPPAKVRLLQPSWMTKADTASLSATIPQESDLLSKIEYVNEHTALKFEQSRTQAAEAEAPLSNLSKCRVWFYFPSISTRSKRDDLVNNAPAYGLTGFLLAGKPGVMCLEGNSDDIDEYMRFIKTESWGDIPAGHKKITEKYRETDIKSRVFANMSEITDQIERRGQRANRNDMKALESYLDEQGLKEAFSKILI